MARRMYICECTSQAHDILFGKRLTRDRFLSLPRITLSGEDRLAQKNSILKQLNFSSNFLRENERAGKNCIAERSDAGVLGLYCVRWSMDEERAGEVGETLALCRSTRLMTSPHTVASNDSIWGEARNSNSSKLG